MRCFGTLMGYEYKKLLKRKIVWITLVILSAFAIFVVYSKMTGLVISYGNQTYTSWDMLREDKAASAPFEGKEMDDGTLTELEEVQKDINMWVPDTLFNYVSQIRDKASEGTKTEENDNEIFQLTGEELIQMRTVALEKTWRDQNLTNAETKIQVQEEQKLTMPPVFNYAECFQQLISIIYAVGIMQSLLIAVCIPQIFTEEHQRKTAQLILSSRFGRKELFLAKMFVGITFSVLGTLLLYGFTVITACSIYGTSGFASQIQMYFPMLSWNLTMGQMLCILMGMGIVSAAGQSALGMVLAEKYKNSTATMAILTGVMLITCFINVPLQFRALSQFWGFLPVNLFSPEYAFSGRMISIFGTHLPTWQAAPIIYLFITGIAIFAGMRLYKNYQVGER